MAQPLNPFHSGASGAFRVSAHEFARRTFRDVPTAGPTNRAMIVRLHLQNDSRRQPDYDEADCEENYRCHRLRVSYALRRQPNIPPVLASPKNPGVSELPGCLCDPRKRRDSDRAGNFHPHRCSPRFAGQNSEKLHVDLAKSINRQQMDYVPSRPNHPRRALSRGCTVVHAAAQNC